MNLINNQKPWVIQIGHSRDGLRNYARPVARRGMLLCIVDSEIGESSRLRSDLIGEAPAAKILVSDNAEHDAIVRSALDFAADHRVVQVVPGFELFTHTAATVREALNLTGPSSALLAVFRSKSRQRSAMASYHVPQPQSFACESSDDAILAADEMGYPVVVKPDDAGGSQGVQIARNAAEVAAAYALASSLILDDGTFGSGLVLIEEFVPGAEFGVSGVVDCDGAVRIVGVTERTIYRGQDETACLILRDIACLPTHAAEELLSVARSAIESLNLRSSPFDMDIRMPGRGDARVIECAARITGGSVPACYRHLGIDIGELAVAAVLGEKTAEDSFRSMNTLFCGQEYLVNRRSPKDRTPALPYGEMRPGERGEVVIFSEPSANLDYEHISGRFGIARVVASSVERVHHLLDRIVNG